MLAEKPKESGTATTLGCFALLAVVAASSIFSGQLNLTSWFQSVGQQSGRCQIISTTTDDPLSGEKDVHRAFKINTATGKAWVYVHLERSGGPHLWAPSADAPPVPASSPVP